MDVPDEITRSYWSQTPRTAESDSSVQNQLIVGRYRVKSCLGIGGFAEVHLAHDTILDRQVALKIPRTDKK